MLDAQERAVCGQRAAKKAAAVGSAQPHVLAGPMELARRLPIEGDVDCKAVAVSDPGDDDAWSLGEAVAPPVRNTVEEGSRLAAAERLHDPSARLVARVVREPEHALAVERG